MSEKTKTIKLVAISTANRAVRHEDEWYKVADDVDITKFRRLESYLVTLQNNIILRAEKTETKPKSLFGVGRNKSSVTAQPKKKSVLATNPVDITKSRPKPSSADSASPVGSVITTTSAITARGSEADLRLATCQLAVDVLIKTKPNARSASKPPFTVNDVCALASQLETYCLSGQLPEKVDDPSP